MAGFFAKFKRGLAKTSRTIFSPIGGLFGSKKLDADALEELEESLYSADFGVETTEEILEEIQSAYRKNKDLRGQEAAAIGASVLKQVLAGSAGQLTAAETPPTVIVLLGVNGSGKTTTTAKLAHRLTKEGRSVLVAACDTFRAAAVEQLRTWCDRLSLDLIASQRGADSAAVAFDAMQAAKARGKEFLLIDTAGRLHNKSHLMDELAKIRRVLAKHDPSAPHHAWLVADGSLGSNTVEQARVFNEAFGLTGLVVTKLDGTSRGGALAGIYRELQIPVFFLGLGEGEEDLQPYDVDHYTQAVFGLGDD